MVKTSLSNERVQVRFLVEDLRSPHTLQSKKIRGKKTIENRSNIVTNSIKTLKMVHIKKKKTLKG